MFYTQLHIIIGINDEKEQIESKVYMILLQNPGTQIILMICHGDTIKVKIKSGDNEIII